MKSLVLLLCLLGAATAKVSYEGHQIWSVDVSTTQARDDLIYLVKAMDLDIFSESRTEARFLVSPERQNYLARHFGKLQLKHSVLTENVQAVIDAEDRARNGESRAFTLDDYNTFEDIEVYLAEVANATSYANLVSIGQSIEGRDQWQLQFSVGAGKPVVWIDCGIHAREWITPATCLYGIDMFANGYGSNPDVTELLDRADVYILPVYNPDGYSFTWAQDRLWRKNRRVWEDGCFGVDLNRNFDSTEWAGAGTSANHCRDTYPGDVPASEIETQNGQAAMAALSSRMLAMFSIHSYSQLYLYPFGYTDDIIPPEADAMDACAAAGVQALTAMFGTVYEYGPIATTIYPASGTTVDFVYELGVVYSYTLELRDTGTFGFELPAEQIPDTAAETWAGLFASIACMP